MWTELFRTVALVEMGLAAGVLFGVALAVLPGFATLTPAGYVRAHQLIDPHYEPTMPVLVMTSTIANVLLVFLVDTAVDRVLHALAALFLLGVVLISQFIAIPLLRNVRGVNPDDLPPGWRDPRQAWSFWHRCRTVLAVLALVAAIAAASF